MDALPYYKWYWIDYRANRKVQRMCWQTRGLYRELLDEFWSEGSLPTDMESLADICGCTVEEFTALWPQMKPCWEVTENRLINAKMDAQRTEVDITRAAKARAGSKGGSVSNSLTRAKDVQASANLFQAQPDIAEQSRAENEQEQSRLDGTVFIPEWIPLELWHEFSDNRKSIKSAMGDIAKKKAINKLDGFRKEGYDIVWIINETILNNWKSLFANNNTPKIPIPKKEWRPSTQRELDEQNYKDFGSPPPEEWAPEGAPQGWIPCR